MDASFEKTIKIVQVILVFAFSFGIDDVSSSDGACFFTPVFRENRHQPTSINIKLDHLPC